MHWLISRAVDPHKNSVFVELMLGHLRDLPTDVPPQPNSPYMGLSRSCLEHVLPVAAALAAHILPSLP